MKYILIVLFLFPLISFSQDCSLKNEKDRFNQDPRLTTGFKSLGAGADKFLLSISADKKEVDYFFALDKSTLCFNDYARATISFDNKQKGIYRNGGTTNCKGYFHFIFPNQENLNGNLTKLSLNKVINIQFANAENVKKIITLLPEDQEEVKKMTGCVLAELEKLRIDTWKPKQ